MTILVDMDDVLETLIEGWVEYLNDHYGTSVTSDDINDWDMTLAFPTLTPEQVYSAELDDSLWDRVGPKQGAREALEKMIADGHEIYIVTATYYQTLKAKMENVLFKYFPFITWDNVIITSNKQMVMGDVLIDDGPHNLVGGTYKKILFDVNHNRSFDEKSVGAIRAHNWDEVYDIVCKMANEKEIHDV